MEKDGIMTRQGRGNRRDDTKQSIWMELRQEGSGKGEEMRKGNEREETEQAEERKGSWTR